MELNKFLQEDIIEFLDQKSSEQREKKGLLRSEEFSLFSLDKDFAKETEEAIKNNDLAKAKSIFDQLKEAYELNKGKEEQEKIHAVLEEVYEKIKNGIETKKTLEEELREFAAKGTAYEKPAAKEERMQKTIDAINKAVQQKNLKVAVQNYNDLKEQFTRFPSDDKEKKIKWYNELLMGYELIKRSEKKLEKNNVPLPIKEKVVVDKKSVEEAKACLKKLISSLEESDVHKSKAALIDARHKVALINNKFSKEKNELEGILNTITHRIEFIARQQHRTATKIPEDPAAKTVLPKPEKPQPKEEPKSVEQEKHEIVKEEIKNKPEIKVETPTSKIKKEEQKPIAKKVITPKEKTHNSIAMQGTTKVMVNEKNESEKLYHQALTLQHSGKEEEAKKLYEKIIKESPNNMRAQIRLEQLQRRGKK